MSKPPQALNNHPQMMSKLPQAVSGSSKKPIPFKYGQHGNEKYQRGNEGRND